LLFAPSIINIDHNRSTPLYFVCFTF